MTRAAPFCNQQSRRSPSWIKIKCGKRQEFIIGGYTEPQGSRTGLGALLLGVYENGALQYVGRVGTGFNDVTLAELNRQLVSLAADKRPFASKAGIAKGAHWVKPALVAEVSFGRWPRGGGIQHAVFHGLRADKDPATIMREVAVGE